MNAQNRTSGFGAFWYGAFGALQWRLLLLWVLGLCLPTAIVAIPFWRALAGQVDYSVRAGEWATRLDVGALYDLIAAMQQTGYTLNSGVLLGLVATYRMSDTVMGVMANVFYIDQGFTKEQIASVSKLFGLFMTLLGAGLGGLLIVRFGIMPILFIGGVASAATNLLFLLLADMGAHLQMLILTISCDNFSSGLATAAFVAYLSSLTNLKFSATQYALLSSIMMLLPRLIGGYSGTLVENLGYAQFFLFTAILGIPTLLLILLQWHKQNRLEQAVTDAA